MSTDLNQATEQHDPWEEGLTSATQPDLDAQDRHALKPKAKGQRRESSFAAVVADLEVGQSASRVHHLNSEMTLAEMQRDMREMKAMIANNAKPSVNIARQRTGGEYRVETGETITTAGRVFLVVIVTRVA